MRTVNREKWHQPNSSYKSKLPTLAERSKNRNNSKDSSVSGKVMKEIHHHHHLHKQKQKPSPSIPILLIALAISSGAIVQRQEYSA